MLSTGRCGSVTFARACQHLQGFTVGHETRAAEVGEDRFAYPDQHIEVDNRLSWFLGGLSARFPAQDTMYVHLTRDPDEVAASFLARWDSPFRASMIRAFAHGVVMSADWEQVERQRVCRFYVDTVNQNIEQFLAVQPRTARVRLESVERDFSALLDALGAQGDRDAALAEWSVRHNATRNAAVAEAPRS